ncbi:MAG: CHAT domain-containing tetratricopeptide repeat protein [Actinomycetota bacterium]|nr:CHAT domain-containing tetratricopeptide repeat protein [Actinomycetota bacterium]
MSDPEAPAAVRAQILITLAKVESELHGLNGGLSLLAQASEILDRRFEPSVAVALHNQRGVLMLRFGKLRAAIAAFDEAEEFFASAAPLEQANVLLNRGSAALMLGDLGPAGRDLRRCAIVARDSDLPLLQCMSLHNLGYLEFLRGELPQALRTMQAAADLGVETNSVGLLDRARVLAEAGLTREADSVLAAAADILRKDGQTQELGETELERARCALISGDVASARRLAARARDRFRRRGNDPWRRTSELVLLQGDVAAGRPGRRLIAPALRLRAELAGEGLRMSARTAALIAVEAQLAADQVPAAVATMAELVPATSRRDPITARLHTRYVAARLAESLGNLGAAGRHVRTGLRELVSYQASFGSVDLQTASAVHGRRLSELGLAIALRRGRPTDIFAAAEQARAVSARLPVVRPPEDATAAHLLAELRQIVEDVRSADQHSAKLAPLLKRRRELEGAIAARRWTTAGAGIGRPIAGLVGIRSAVASANSSMVMFIEAGGRLHALIVGGARTRLRELGPIAPITEQVRRVRADLDVLAQPRLAGSIAVAVRATLLRSVRALDSALVSPLGVDGQRLIVISTGILGQLPWAAMPSLRGVPVVVAPSATSWLTATQTREPGGRLTLVAVAGPDLVRGRHEVAGVAAAWLGGRSVPDAGRQALADALTRSRVAHIAAHGVHQTENPMFSSLRLFDGPVFAHELDQTARTPEHVVLSACELGLATVRPGDEALGLTSVLLRLGTRSVVAGVARVGDEAAAETMIDYHRRLAAGLDSAAALAEAISAGDGVLPFVCFGSAWSAGPVAGPTRGAAPGATSSTTANGS